MWHRIRGQKQNTESRMNSNIFDDFVNKKDRISNQGRTEWLFNQKS